MKQIYVDGISIDVSEDSLFYDDKQARFLSERIYPVLKRIAPKNNHERSMEAYLDYIVARKKKNPEFNAQKRFMHRYGSAFCSSLFDRLKKSSVNLVHNNRMGISSEFSKEDLEYHVKEAEKEAASQVHL